MTIDSHKRSFIKSLSWRFLSLIIIFTVSYLVTNNLTIATSISIIDTFFKMIIYYAHERYWAHVKWGRIKRYSKEDSLKNDNIDSVQQKQMSSGEGDVISSLAKPD